MAVTISSAVRTNLNSLQSISSQQSTVQNRLATGKKVNSALDNATSFFTASSFTNRASSLSSLLDSVSTGVQTLQAANNGITSITNLVNQLRSTAQQALQSTSAYTSQAKLTSSTTISGASAADIRGASAAATATNSLSSLTSGTAAETVAGPNISTFQSAAAAKLTGTVDYTTPGSIVTANQTVTIASSAGTTIATFDSTATDGSDGKFNNLTTLKAALNRGGNTDFTASDDGSGHLVITAADQSKSFTVGGTAASGLGLATTQTNAQVGTKIRVDDGTTAQTFTYDSNATASDALKFSSFGDLNNKLAGQNIQVSTQNTGTTTFKATGLNNSVKATYGDGTALGSIPTTAYAGTAGDVLTVNDGSITKSYVFDSNAAATDKNRFKNIDDLNTKLTNANVKATATESGGKLNLAATTPTTTLTVSGTAQTSAKLGIGGTSGIIAPSGDGGALNGKTLTFALSGGQTTTVTFGDPATTSGAVKSLDDLNSKLSGVGLSASLDSSGALSFQTTSQTASQTFSVSGTATGTGSKFTGTASSAVTRGGSGADNRDSLVTQFNGLLNQIDTIAKDSNFNGLNLLNGDTLSLIFNETNTSKLDVNGTSANSTGLGLSNVTASNFNDGNGINSILSLVDKAKSSLSTQSSKFGSNLAVVQTRQDFTKQTISTLSTGADNLVNADLNEEATNLLSLNTSQSLAQQALSLANQSQQSVLQLLR